MRIIAGATGLIGTHLVEDWLTDNHEITVIGRSLKRIDKIFAGRVKAVTWDKLTVESLRGAEVVVNLTGENVGKKRWNETLKKEIMMSRVGSTKKLANLLAELGPEAPVLFNASAIGVYGLQTQLPDRLPPRLDETAPINFDNPPEFLAQVATRAEKAAEPAIAANCRVVFLRLGVVLAREGGALPQLMKPFEFYLGGPIGTGNQPVSWISIDDVIAAINFLLTQSDAQGAYNIVAPDAIRQGMLAETISNHMVKPDAVRMPAFVLNLMFGKEMARELLLEGQRIYPARLLELGFKFSYPDIESAINHVFRAKNTKMNFFSK